MINKNTWISNIILSLASLIIFLLFTECVFRLFSIDLEASVIRDRPKFWYFPNDTLEFRDRYYSPIKNKDVYRVIVVGDSFTFGGKCQFDDNFSKRLERMFNLHSGSPRVEVLNWGVPGYSTRNEIDLVTKALNEYNPDLLLLQITLNDPEFYPLNKKKFLNLFGKSVILNNIITRSMLLKFTVGRIQSALLRMELKNYYLELFENKETWLNFSTSVKFIKDEVDRFKVPIFALTFPLFDYPLDDDYPFKTNHEKINNLLSELNIPNVDLYESYKNIPVIRLQAIPGEDNHPNEIAHRIAADAVYQKLIQNNLIPKELHIEKMLEIENGSRALNQGNKSRAMF